MLTGIPTTGLGTIKYTILKGDPVNVFVQVDDLDAQAAVRAQLPGSDGIIEDELQDGRLSYTEGRARCQARLDLLGARDSDGLVGAISVTYRCRDTNTIAGATVVDQRRPADQSARRLSHSAGERGAIPRAEPEPDLHRRGVEPAVLRRGNAATAATGGTLMAVTITRSVWIDDDGTGTTGTVINQALHTTLYNEIDTALAKVAQLAGGNTFTGKSDVSAATS